MYVEWIVHYTHAHTHMCLQTMCVYVVYIYVHLCKPHTHTAGILGGGKVHVAPRRQRSEAATGHPGVGTGQSTCCNVCCPSTLCCPAGTGYLGNVLVEQCVGVAEYVAQVIAQLGEISILYCALQRSVRFEQNLQIDHIILHTAQYNILGAIFKCVQCAYL